VYKISYFLYIGISKIGVFIEDFGLRLSEGVAWSAALAIAKVWGKAMGVNRGGCFVGSFGDCQSLKKGDGG
jgi:hypothetical protein